MLQRDREKEILLMLIKKKLGVSVSISNREGFRTRKVIKDNVGHKTMTKVSSLRRHNKKI